MSNKYPNLPGVNMRVKDGQLLLSTNRTLNSLLIIAPAHTNMDVPDGPMYISSQEELTANFGGFFYQGTLNPIAANWVIASQAGISNIYLMALKQGDKKAQFVDLYEKLFGVMTDLRLSHIIIDGLYADEDITGLEPADFEIESIDEAPSLPAHFVYKGTEAPVAPTAMTNLTIQYGDLDIVISIEPKAIDANALDMELQEAINNQNLTMDAKIQMVDGVIQLQFTDHVTLSGDAALAALGLTDVVQESKIHGNPAALLANYAELISEEIGGTIAYIATKPPTAVDLASVKSYVNRLVERDNQVSPYLQVVAGPQVGVTVPGNLRTQWMTGVTHYAILVNSLLPQYAPTNQPLPGASQLRFNLSPRQLNDLTGNKYVTFRVRNNQIRVVDGVTTAPDLSIGQDIIKSDFTRLSTLRITNYVVERIRQACEAFIGSPNEFYNYNAMNTEIKSVINDTIERGIIQDAAYTIRLGQSLDTADINLTILPQFELRTINATVALRRPDEFM